MAAAGKTGSNSSYGSDIGVKKIIDQKCYRIQYKNDLSDNEQAFDIITAWHVIERLRPAYYYSKFSKRVKNKLQNSSVKLIIK